MPKCHLCESLSQLEHNEQDPKGNKIFLAVCCIKRCNKSYCIKCINTRFDENFSEKLYKSDTWICYSCQSLCSCILCKGLNNDKKVVKKKNKELSQKSNKKNEGKNNQNQIENKLNDFFTPQQIASVSPFMKKVLVRKNMLYKMILQHPTHPQNQKNKSHLKQSTFGSLEIEGQSLKEIDKMEDESKSAHEIIKMEEKKSQSKKPTNLQRMISQTMKAYEDDDEQEIEIELL